MGTILFIRFFDIAGSPHLVIGNTGEYAFFYSIISLFLIVGLLTPLSIFILYLSQTYMTVQTNLANQVNILVLLLLLIYGSGNIFSIDSLFSRTKKFVLFFVPSHFFIKKLISYFSMFLFWCICLHAMILHLGDKNWLDLNVLQVYFMSPFWVKEYQIFHDFYHYSPLLYDVFCKVSLLVQSFWELFLFPLLFFKIGRIFVFVQGILFFLMGAILLHLSYLPYAEICLWIMFFSFLLSQRPIEQENNLDKKKEKKIYLITGILSLFIFSHMAYVIRYESVKKVEYNIFYFYKKKIEFILRGLGQKSVDVINKDHLKMANINITIVEVDKKGNEQTLPFLNEKGERAPLMRNEVLLYSHYFKIFLNFIRKDIFVKEDFTAIISHYVCLLRYDIEDIDFYQINLFEKKKERFIKIKELKIQARYISPYLKEDKCHQTRMIFFDEKIVGVHK